MTILIEEWLPTRVATNRRRSEAMARASYYAWMARHTSVPAAPDPLTGRAWSRTDRLAQGAGRAVYVAQARYWLQVARQMGAVPLP